MALQTMLELAGQATSWVMRLTDPDAQQVDQRVNAYVRRIHQTLSEHGQRNPADAKMGTTWTSAHLFGRQAVIVHLGDSRVYLLAAVNSVQITRDRDHGELLIDRGCSRRNSSARFVMCS